MSKTTAADVMMEIPMASDTYQPAPEAARYGDMGRNLPAPGSSGAVVERVDVAAYRIPTDFPESDGTLSWDSSTIVIVEVRGGGQAGLGYTYAGTPAAAFVRDVLAGVVTGPDCMAVGGIWQRMHRISRNHGRPGVAAMAMAAVDVALWDLKARLLGVSLLDLLGPVRDAIPACASGGFASYPLDRLRDQLGGWARDGFEMVKMKVGAHPEMDLIRVQAAREAIGDDTALFVDAAGAYSRKQALAFAEAFAAFDVKWFQEPVTSDDLEGLRLIRDRAPAGIEIAAGEYGFADGYFLSLLGAGAVDVLMADATRCAGVTGFLRAGALAGAWQIPFSGHSAPSIHAHLCCAVPSARHLEYFHDHVRIEGMLFDGVPTPAGGRLRPDRSRPGLGLTLKAADVEKYRLTL